MINTYWTRDGKHQAIANQLADQIPLMGESDKPHIERFRLVTNAYYDYYNNGWSYGVVNTHIVLALKESPESSNLEAIANQAGGDAAIAWKRIMDAIVAYQYDLEEAKFYFDCDDPNLWVKGSDDFSFEPFLEALLDAIVLDSSKYLAETEEPKSPFQEIKDKYAQYFDPIPDVAAHCESLRRGD